MKDNYLGPSINIKVFFAASGYIVFDELLGESHAAETVDGIARAVVEIVTREDDALDHEK